MTEEKEKFEERIEKIRVLRRQREFSKAKKALEKLKSKLSQEVPSEEYFGEAFVGTPGKFRLIKPEIQRKISAIIYEEGMIWQELEDFAKAREQFVTALEMREETLRNAIEDKSAIVEFALSSFGLARVEYFRIGAVDERVLFFFKIARQRIKRAVRAIEASEKEDFNGLATLYYNLSFMEQARGNFKKAIHGYRHTLLLQKQSGDVRGASLALAGIIKSLDEFVKIDPLSALRVFQEIDHLTWIPQQIRIIKDATNALNWQFREQYLGVRAAIDQEDLLDTLVGIETPDTSVVHREPSRRAISILNLMDRSIERAEEALLGHNGAEPSLLISLLDQSFLEEIRQDYIEVNDFLEQLEQSVPDVREMSVGRLSRRIKKAMAFLKESEFTGQEERCEFAQEGIDVIRQIVLTSKSLSKVRETLLANYGVDLKIAQLWKDYLAKSNFSKDLERLALAFGKGCKFGPKDEKYNVPAIKKTFQELEKKQKTEEA